MKYTSHLAGARRVYSEGGNVAEYLRRLEGSGVNTEAIIEIAYDMQAGTYCEAALKNADAWTRYTDELAGWLEHSIAPEDRVMEVGCGECTTFTGIFRRVLRGAEFFCFDLSWSRIRQAHRFMERFLAPDFCARTTSFVAEMSAMPIADKSVDVVYTSHSLEPNGGRELELLNALFRVARKKVVLFEPVYERATNEARERMALHGYVRGLENAIAAAGGKLEQIEPIKNVANPLNPTFMLEVAPPPGPSQQGVWSCPTSGRPMVRASEVFWCEDAGLAYPILEGIPILRPEAAILASSFTYAGRR